MRPAPGTFGVKTTTSEAMRRRKPISSSNRGPQELKPQTQEQIAGGFFSWGDDGLIGHELSHPMQTTSIDSGGGWYDPWGDGFWT